MNEEEHPGMRALRWFLRPRILSAIVILLVIAALVVFTQLFTLYAPSTPEFIAVPFITWNILDNIDRRNLQVGENWSTRLRIVHPRNVNLTHNDFERKIVSEFLEGDERRDFNVAAFLRSETLEINGGEPSGQRLDYQGSPPAEWLWKINPEERDVGDHHIIELALFEGSGELKPLGIMRVSVTVESNSSVIGRIWDSGALKWSLGIIGAVIAGVILFIIGYYLNRWLQSRTSS